MSPWAALAAEAIASALSLAAVAAWHIGMALALAMLFDTTFTVAATAWFGTWLIRADARRFGRFLGGAG